MKRPWLPAAAFLTLAAPAARADGAFPDDLRLMLPHTAPQRLVLATNFGLVLSDDEGATWSWVCESAITGGPASIRLYDQGPRDALYASWPEGIARSDDGGCGWTASGGSIAGRSVSDVFADPADETRVFAIASSAGGSGVYVSRDHGNTFDPPLVESKVPFLSVESARSAPGTVLATTFGAPASDEPAVPSLLRSTDGGAHFTPVALDTLPPARVRILAIDPVDATVAYLRVTRTDASRDDLAILHGDAVTVELVLPGLMSGFAKAEDGTLFVGTPDGALWTRAAGATTWTSQPGPHFRCLTERAGVLYGCGSDLSDGYALARSRDRGASWEPLLRFRDIRGTRACGDVEATCGEEWETLKVRLGVPEEAPDAGSEEPVADAGVDADGGVSVPHPALPVTGCGCGGDGAAGAVGLAMVAWWRRRR